MFLIFHDTGRTFFTAECIAQIQNITTGLEFQPTDYGKRN